MDIETLKKQILELQGDIRYLRQEEAKFIKAQGLDEQKEKARAAILKINEQITATKAELKELKKKKADAVAPTAEALAETMSTILPHGQAVFEISDDGKVFIGWKRNGGLPVPHGGLSGGEKIMFDAALSFALLGSTENKILILEAAEMDNDRLFAALEHLTAKNPDAQIICNTCHAPEMVPSGWQVVEVQR